MNPAAGAALIRVAAYPTDLVIPDWPDLTSSHPSQWRSWLHAVWELPGFTAAVAAAAPELAEQVQRAVTDELMAEHRLRRLVEAVVRYLLRWTTRATPFGTFAGVAPVEFGPHAAVRLGDAHHAVTRPDGMFVAEQADHAEQNLASLRAATVVTNSLGYQRGSKWVVPCARTDGDKRWDAEIRMTPPVRAAIESAKSPIDFAILAAGIAGPSRVAEAERLLADLVNVGVLLSALRPPMTCTDPAQYPGREDNTAEPGDQVAVDLRVDAMVTLPPVVLREAARAASALVAVAPPSPRWAEYHRAFIERWGPGAAVPLRELLNVLGFPAGYRGSARRLPASFTARDRLLGQLAQESAVNGGTEVILDDELIGRLQADEHRAPMPHTELRFTLAAKTVHDLDRGAFTLTVVSGARHAGVSAARLLHLLAPSELAAFRRVFQQLPTASPGAITVQLSAPPLDPRLTTLARAPELLPVLPVGDFHPAPPWTVEDLAVTGDGERLWLVSKSTGQPVEPLLLNSVLLPALQQPLTRFLTEIWTAWMAPCSRFDWGQVSDVPFLPRVRRERSVLHPARWLLHQADLPPRHTDWPHWRDAWQRYREQRRMPQHVLVGDDDVRLRLDLDNSTHLAVLRSHVQRHARTVITEAPGPAGWIGGRPAELMLTLTHAMPASQPVRAARVPGAAQEQVGQSRWIEARLYGRTDDILTNLASQPDDHLPAGWWFLRYPDPEQHLRLRIPLSGPGQFGTIARRLAAWVQTLTDDAVLHDYSLHTYRPEARHGAGETLAAAEAVFAADSRVCLTLMDGDRQAAAAAGMITIAEGFTNDGLRWLTEHVPPRTGPRLTSAQLDRVRVTFHDVDLLEALSAYRALAERDGLDVDQVLPDLLHLHHARMIGVDTDSERHCLRLARTIAHAAHARHAR